LEGGKNSLAAIPNSVKATVPVVSGNAIAGFRGPMGNIIVEDPPEVYLSEVPSSEGEEKASSGEGLRITTSTRRFLARAQECVGSDRNAA
jgi:hypothetical protein